MFVSDIFLTSMYPFEYARMVEVRLLAFATAAIRAGLFCSSTCSQEEMLIRRLVDARMVQTYPKVQQMIHA